MTFGNLFQNTLRNPRVYINLFLTGFTTLPLSLNESAHVLEHVIKFDMYFDFQDGTKHFFCSPLASTVQLQFTLLYNNFSCRLQEISNPRGSYSSLLKTAEIISWIAVG